MSDDFLLHLREEPSPQFAQALAWRLTTRVQQQIERQARLRRWTITAASAAFIVALVAVPGVRATARELLELFRVRRFAALPFDEARWQRLAQGLDLRTLLGDEAEVVVQEPTESVGSFAEGAARAGIDARLPAFLPRGFELADVRVQGHLRVRFTLDKAKLDALLQTFGIRDLEVPAQADGAVVTIDAPKHLITRYRRRDDTLALAQSQSPQVTLPAGLELARLGEIALRVAGLSAAEASAFARTIDWRGTLMVPVPVERATYRRVDVQGHSALLVQSRRDTGRVHDAVRRGAVSVLAWTDEECVYSLSGSASEAELLEMADSLR